MADNKTFVIDGEDYKKLMEFKKKHAKCWERHPNLTGGPGLQYSFVEDSFEEQYYKFFEAFKTVLNRDYTEYLQELGIGEIK